MAKSKAHVVECNVPVPSPDPRPFVPAISLPANRETAFLALHASVCGFLMHWVNNQPIPHPRDREWCAGCKLGQTPRWTGFLGVISLNTMNRFILGIPKAAFRESGVFRDMSDAGMLAGTKFTSYRFGHAKSKTNPAVIEMVEDDYPVPRMNPFPLLPALARWWRMETLQTIDQVKRPEEADTKLARDQAEWAQRWKAFRAKGKGAQP
jgi:hypothetical protein